MMVQGYAVPHSERARTRSHFDHDSSRLMSENPRRGNRSIVNLFDVCRTNTARSDPDQDLSGADLGNRNLFDAQVVGSAVDDRPHGCRHFVHVSEWLLALESTTTGRSLSIR